MSVFGLFRRQDIVVTDVTRMEAGRVCIACLRGRQQMRLSAPPPTRKWIDSIGGLNPGDTVAFRWRSVKRFRPPHSEDGDWTPSSFDKTGALAYEHFYDVLARQAKSSVRSAFGKPAFSAKRGNPAFPADRGKHSLATLRASSIRIYRHENKIRADFQDKSNHWSMVPVEDLRLWRHLDHCPDCPANFESRLASAMGGDEGLLRIGLGRPFQPDGREIGCFLQVNHVFMPQSLEHFS